VKESALRAQINAPLSFPFSFSARRRANEEREREREESKQIRRFSLSLSFFFCARLCERPSLSRAAALAGFRFSFVLLPKSQAQHFTHFCITKHLI
jgi:hypothetical protein